MLALALDYAVLKSIRFAKKGVKNFEFAIFPIGGSHVVAKALLVAFPMRVSKRIETLLQSYY